MILVIPVNPGNRDTDLVLCFNSDDVVFITDMTSNVNKSLSQSKVGMSTNIRMFEYSHFIRIFECDFWIRIFA